MQQHFFLLVRLVGNVRASAYGVADFGRSSENIWHGFIVLSGVGFRGSRGFPLRKSLSRRSLDGVFALSIGEASTHCTTQPRRLQSAIPPFIHRRSAYSQRFRNFGHRCFRMLRTVRCYTLLRRAAAFRTSFFVPPVFVSIKLLSNEIH